LLLPTTTPELQPSLQVFGAIEGKVTLPQRTQESQSPAAKIIIDTTPVKTPKEAILPTSVVTENR